jgi:hypothetical protein
LPKLLALTAGDTYGTGKAMIESVHFIASLDPHVDGQNLGFALSGGYGYCLHGPDMFCADLAHFPGNQGDTTDLSCLSNQVSGITPNGEGSSFLGCNDGHAVDTNQASIFGTESEGPSCGTLSNVITAQDGLWAEGDGGNCGDGLQAPPTEFGAHLVN